MYLTCQISLQFISLNPVSSSSSVLHFSRISSNFPWNNRTQSCYSHSPGSWCRTVLHHGFMCQRHPFPVLAFRLDRAYVFLLYALFGLSHLDLFASARDPWGWRWNLSVSYGGLSHNSLGKSHLPTIHHEPKISGPSVPDKTCFEVLRLNFGHSRSRESRHRSLQDVIAALCTVYTIQSLIITYQCRNQFESQAIAPSQIY
jgi:hypothetical protein